MNKLSNQGRIRLLTTASATVAAFAIASAATAATTVVSPVNPTAPETTTANNGIDVPFNEESSQDAVSALQVNQADILAQVRNTLNGVGQDDDPSAQTTITVETNQVAASAAGNVFSHSMDLFVTENDDEDGDGSAALGVQINGDITGYFDEEADPYTITAIVEANNIGADLEDYENGALSVSDNSITGDASGNRASTTVAGTIPGDYSSTLGGGSLLTNDPLATASLQAEGGQLSSTLQVNFATVQTFVQPYIYDDEGDEEELPVPDGYETNAIWLDLDSDGDNVVTSAPTVDGNLIGASAQGNSSNSTIDLQAGDAPTYAGGAVVTNGQANVGDVGAFNAFSSIGASIWSDDNFEGDINTLAGSLSVEDNTISASASGNQTLGAATGQAGNRILLGDGVSFDGPGDTASSEAGTDSTESFSQASADLVIHNSQGNTIPSELAPVNISAGVYEAYIVGDVQALGDPDEEDEDVGGSVSVSGNTIAATARGNAVTSAFATGDNSALFSGSVAVASEQVNYNAAISAENGGVEGGGSTILARVDNDEDLELLEGSVTVDDNTQSATAYGSQSGQSLTIAAANVDLPAGGVFLTGGSGDPEGNVSAEGGAIVTNLQLTYESTVGADLESASIGAQIEAVTLEGSSVSVAGNRQEAVAGGASTSNALTIASTNLSGGAGIVSVQVADEVFIESDAAAVTAASAIDVSGSSIDVSGNLTQAVAYGGSAANTLNVDATVVDVESNEGTASVVILDPDETFVLDNEADDQPSVVAAYGLLNIQSTSASVAADLEGYEGFQTFSIFVDESIDDGSSLANDGNAAVAAAYGADAVNEASLDAGNVLSEGSTSVLNLTNAQTLTELSSVTASASGNLIRTLVDVDVVDSSISTSGNAVRAQAYGNLADNEVAADATNINAVAAGVGLVTVEFWGDVESSTNAAFSLNNAQAASGSIVASLVDDIEDPEVATTILTVVGDGATGPGGDLRRGSIASDDNTLSAGATGNRADNLLDLAGSATLTTTASLVNSQTSEANLAAVIGIAGSDPVPAQPGTDDEPFPFTYELVLSNTGCSDGTCSGVTGIDRVPLSELSDEEEAALISDGWEINGSNIERPTVQTVPTTMTSLEFAQLGGTTYPGSSVIEGLPGTPAFAGTPNEGGVIAYVRDDVVFSSISVDGNTIAGSVTGNSATNELTVEGNQVNQANGQISTLVELRDGGDDDSGNDSGEIGEVNADFGLNNVQNAGDSLITSNVYGTLAIDFDFGLLTSFENSTLTIDDNEQSSRAVANTAANTVELSATNTDAGVALGSSQFGSADVEAVSNLDMFVPVSGLNTSVSVSDNTNLSLAVSNNVTNQLTVEATNAAPVNAERDVRLLSDSQAGNVRAGGDYILANQQITTDDVTSTANTTIWNDDYLDDDTDALSTWGIRSSTIAVTGNTTVAEATANRAVNVADVSAGATLNASAGVVNYQLTTGEETTVTANASTNASVALGTAEDPLFAVAVDGGSVTLGQNTTSSLARGNAATNVLNYAAGSNYGGTTIGSDPYTSLNGVGENTLRARAGVLNNQVNNAAVSANTTNTSYVIALNSDEGSVVSGATIGVIGNTLSAAAYGNTATNTLTVAALNTNAASAAIGNVQRNTGPVTASVATVTYGVTSGVGAAFGSSINVTGNAVTATAVGNNSVSTIAAN